MYAVEVDLKDDRFDVAFDAGRVTVVQLLRTVRELDYEPELVTDAEPTPPPAERVDVAALPEDRRALFAEARRKERPVLVEFSGPG